jgi:hypothetical protein
MESQWYLNALAEMHADIVFECTVVEKQVVGGGEMEKVEYFFYDPEENADLHEIQV